MQTMEIETLASSSFSAFLEQSCWIEAGNGILETTVARVRETPNSALPNAQRTPFIVLLRGPEDPVAGDGICALRTEGWRVEGVYINRVMPPLDLAPGAYYQVVFN